MAIDKWSRDQYGDWLKVFPTFEVRVINNGPAPGGGRVWAAIIGAPGGDSENRLKVIIPWPAGAEKTAKQWVMDNLPELEAKFLAWSEQKALSRERDLAKWAKKPKARSNPCGGKWYIKARRKNPGGGLGAVVAQLPKSYSTRAGAVKAGQALVNNYQPPVGCALVVEQGSSRKGNSKKAAGSPRGNPEFLKGQRVQMKADHWTGMGSRGGVLVSPGARRVLVRFDDGTLVDVDNRALELEHQAPKGQRGNPHIPTGAKIIESGGVLAAPGPKGGWITVGPYRGALRGQEDVYTVLAQDAGASGLQDREAHSSKHAMEIFTRYVGKPAVYRAIQDYQIKHGQRVGVQVRGPQSNPGPNWDYHKLVRLGFPNLAFGINGGASYEDMRGWLQEAEVHYPVGAPNRKDWEKASQVVDQAYGRRGNPRKAKPEYISHGGRRLRVPSVREAQEAAEYLGGDAVYDICGPGGLSGASQWGLAKLVREAELARRGNPGLLDTWREAGRAVSRAGRETGAAARAAPGQAAAAVKAIPGKVKAAGRLRVAKAAKHQLEDLGYTVATSPRINPRAHTFRYREYEGAPWTQVRGYYFDPDEGDEPEGSIINAGDHEAQVRVGKKWEEVNPGEAITF